MFLPWIGLFEQVQLAEIFFHYDDVQLPQGRSFTNRVQVKTPAGIIWLTAPLDRARSGQRINEVVLSKHEDWRRKHLTTLKHAYSKAPHAHVALALLEEVYAHPTESLAEFNIHAIERISAWLNLSPSFRRSSEAGIGGSSTQRLVDICASVGATTYVTGLGALNYLAHDEFEKRSIAVRYMQYALRPYPQLHGDFTPYVSIVDAIANVGELTRDLLVSGTADWRTVAKQ
jgi:hypothetical protein